MYPIYSTIVLTVVTAAITATTANPFHHWNCENPLIAPRFCGRDFHHPQEHYNPHQYPHFTPRFPYRGSPHLPTPFQFQRNRIQAPLQFQPQQSQQWQWPTSQNSPVSSGNEDRSRRPLQPGWPQKPVLKLPAQVVKAANRRLQFRPSGPAEAVGISRSESSPARRCDSSSKWSPLLKKCVPRGK